MNSTDSINSYQGVHQNPDIGGGRPGVQRPNQKLPRDVIEALEDNDLERAMMLLRQHQSSESESGNNFLSKFFQMILGSIHFNFNIAKPVPKKVNKNRAPQENRLNGIKQRVRVLARLLFVPVRVAAKVMRFASAALGQAASRTYKHYIKPAAQFMAAPFIKAARVLKERYVVFASAVSKVFEKIKERADEIRDKTIEIAERTVREIKELARPVKIWLTEKFNNMVEKQQWLKNTMGQQLQVVVQAAHMMINFMSFAAVPFAFGVKQIGKGGKALKKRIAKIKEGLNRAKNWLKGKGKKAYSFFKAGIETIAIAVERVWLIVYPKLLAILKKLWSWLTAPFRIFLKYIYKKAARLYKDT